MQGARKEGIAGVAQLEGPVWLPERDRTRACLAAVRAGVRTPSASALASGADVASAPETPAVRELPAKDSTKAVPDAPAA